MADVAISSNTVAAVSPQQQPLRLYLVAVTMYDGEQHHFVGKYEDGCQAVILALSAYPHAMRIAAEVL